jgi:lipid-binding SYLF domain-containing protein
MRIVSSVIILAAVFTAGCSPVPNKAESKEVLAAEVNEAIALFKQQDPGIQRFFDQSAGYVVIPKIFKGAFVLGGAYGKGLLYEDGRMTGYCSMSQATLGISFGGEFFREIIFFRDKADVEKFKSEEYTFSAQATAVALSAGVAAKSDYKDGMAVFVMADAGLMVDASVGGQKFNFVPLTVR